MVRIVAYALAAAIAALATGTLSERLLTFDSAESIILFGLAMGVINAFIKPVVRAVSIPITCLTFGLFAIVINAVLFGLGAYVVPGVDVTWFGAFVGALITSVASGLIFSVLDE